MIEKKAIDFRSVLLSILLCFIVSGCATYGQGVKKSLEHVQTGNYQLAEQEIKKCLKPDGDDRLLYHVELASINRLGGKYSESNSNFEIAERITEDLYTKRSGDILSSLLLNPRQSAYPGNEYENIYINYFKALNYLDLAELDIGNSGRAPFESAKIELKRFDYKLKAYEIAKGNYKEAKDRKKQTFVKLLNIFQKFQGNWLDKDWLQFREDANARYLAGIIYEMSKDYDSARISYQSAAKLYENGYVKQYNLSPKITERAWFDTIRMMIKGGGWEREWRGFARRKLSSKMRTKLKKLSSKNGEIIVIEHLGLSPERKEMNMMLKMNTYTKSLYLYPVLTGSPGDRSDQREWFFLLYADKGLFDIVRNYSNGGLGNAVRGLQRKTIGLGPFWNTAKDLGLLEAIGSTGIRITVPYYPPFKSVYGRSELRVGSQVKTLLKSESIKDLALQNQLLSAGKDLNAALSRASLKNILAVKAAGDLGGGLAALAGKVAAAATSAAETRNWLMLPEEIRVNRIFLPAGSHDVKVVTYDKKGQKLVSETKTFKLKPGETKVWVKRTIAQKLAK